MRRLIEPVREILKSSLVTYWMLLKVMVPVMVAVKLAADFGLIRLLGEWFAPVMGIVGLPGEMGVVWVSALLINIYAGAVALIGILDQVTLTSAQVTVILTMILIAHSLPVEQRIAQLAGPNLAFTTILRLVTAIALGWILDVGYGISGTLQEPAVILWLPSTEAVSGWGEWALSSLRTLAGIFVILVALLAVLKIMKAVGLTDYLVRLMAPFLKRVGISEAAGPMTMVGLLLGLSYGGAVMLIEARKGHMSRRDIFLSISLLCLCHSLIEDTLLMVALGGHWSGILVARAVFSVLVIGAVAAVIRRTPVPVFERFLCAQVRG